MYMEKEPLEITGTHPRLFGVYVLKGKTVGEKN